MQTRKEIGAEGERLAGVFLTERGYTLVTRNFFARGGEIDIIAWVVDVAVGRVLCFIEVKTRSAGEGSAERATGFEKIRRIQFAARVFCVRQRIDMESTPIRFEQVSVYRGADGRVQFSHEIIPVD